MVEYGFNFKTPTAQPTTYEGFNTFRIDHTHTETSTYLHLQEKGSGSAAELQRIIGKCCSAGYPWLRGILTSKWHKEMKVIRLIEKGVKWVDTIAFTLPMPASFQVIQQTDLPSKLKSTRLLSAQAEILDLLAKTQLSYDTMNMVMAKLFGARNDVVIVDSSLVGSVDSRQTSLNTSIFSQVFAGKTSEKILIPVCWRKNHWCGIMMNLGLTGVCIYDSMGSSYALSVRGVAEKLVTQLPDYTPRIYRMHHYQSDLGVQVDSHNRGVYV
ncbi:Hypothetical protein PHPALM_18472 [Phytophthora palmivora]|uniref:Ubiquitin-like protease family profile domain-containing protein n=1 Tax=Phytophthora palmivora TaxID=4796 RepID=A0A2P4XJN6_9STRA|nr:Hypothetical protein PHPALM_18472 [Phytophthora palmivora]